jgi:uncharacterized protein YbaR (Trm112 family)|tara:strand:+ start:32 stop:196 length:165 start_codon:yes stop_codon:yes gene_type:complete
MNELKACPFCSGKAIVGLFLIGCPECKMTFMFDPQKKGDMDEAIKKWNERVGDN